MIAPIIQQLNRCDTVLVASHTGPDGDAIGSLLAMGLALCGMKKNCYLYNESPIPAIYRYLPEVDRIQRSIDPSVSLDTAVILDCGDLDRIGALAETVRDIPVVINLDHHLTNRQFGQLNCIDTSASATAEIVYRILKQLDVPITLEMATSIYTGILTDTGSFRFSNTTPAAFQICKEMTETGVNPYEVAQHVFGTYSLGRIKLLNLALNSIEISLSGKLSLMTVTRDMLMKTGTQPEDIDGLIHYARRIEDVKVAALIQEIGNGHQSQSDHHRYHVSLRSDGTIDVAVIASAYGGGGHQTAAGFGIEEPLSSIKSKIIGLAADQLSEQLASFEG